MSAGQQPSRAINTPLQYVKGVGPNRAEPMARLGLRTALDLLFFFPRGYHDLSQLRSIAELAEEGEVSVRGTIVEVDHRPSAGGSMTGALLDDGSDCLRAIWFNQPFVRDRLRVGQAVTLFGKPRLRGGRWEMAHPRLEPLTDPESEAQQPLQPIYRLTEGLGQRHLRRAMQAVLSEFGGQLDEVFPPALLDRYQLLPLVEAVEKIHFPPDQGALDEARRRFVFQELFFLQLALGLRRYETLSGNRALPLPATAKIDARIRRLFPFGLTEDQEQAIGEITADMQRDVPMNRLLQGDVGTGKTVVAAYAMLLCVAHGAQAALMAPTEILARQHLQTLTRMLSASNVRMELLTGSLTARQREDVLARAAAGEIDILIGTQAVISGEHRFRQLGLVVIDEQHRFGVRQRAALRETGQAPHYLVMTATPIPRSLAMTLFGDLEVSTIRTPPAGRQRVRTYLVEPAKRSAWWDYVRRKVNEGQQAYVVAPLVDQSDQLEAESAENLFEQLSNGELEAYRLGLLHGQLGSAEKEATMGAFRRGDYQVLVSTSLIEVGVDVPNATLMTIESPQRFGLAQLHQLRGRVSRGKTAGACGLFLDDDVSPEARERIAALAGTSDGFELAEIDFRLRGPGDLLGTRQHGLPPLRIADLAEDADILTEARQEATRLLSEDPGLKNPEHKLLRTRVLARYARALDLGDVG